MKSNLTTGAGQANKARSEHPNKDKNVDAINQVFALFKLNYHNQFFKAFNSTTDLHQTKRLWLESLSRFDSTTLLKAAKSVIEGSEFLPTLHTMLRHCEKHSQGGLPEAHQAYVEACRAPSPKANQPWSHVAVYYAGKASDWHFLHSRPEDVAFPVFKENYLEICAQLRAGTTLDNPHTPSLPEENTQVADKQQGEHYLAKLKASFDILS